MKYLKDKAEYLFGMGSVGKDDEECPHKSTLKFAKMKAMYDFFESINKDIDKSIKEAQGK